MSSEKEEQNRLNLSLEIIWHGAINRRNRIMLMMNH
jgi:hypothetical protein